MTYQNRKIAIAAGKLEEKFDELDDKASILRAPELKALAAEIPTLEPKERAAFGKELNKLKSYFEKQVKSEQEKVEELGPIDVTAPFDVNTKEDKRPKLLTADKGSMHPLTKEIKNISDIFSKMGFYISESRQIDDDYHMFGALNFPQGHPARDDYDTFMTTEGLIAPAHTSTMQNRILRTYKDGLEEGKPIAVLVPDRVFRNEDLDARHEHTFYQYEGIYVDEGVHAGMLIASLKAFFQEYFETDLEVKTQPFYFPFTEPSFEFAASCVFCSRKGCNICSYTGWIELGGCGMIHPNVLKEGGIDPKKYTGFAWGFGVERTVMLKSGIEDIRHFHSAKLDFLRQFK